MANLILDSKEFGNVDNRLTSMMVDDMICNPLLAARVLLGLRLPPHEELRILMMWQTFYTIDDSGFSTGKSFTFAILCSLRSILFPGRVSGIISKTFAQGKLIFKNLDKWSETNKIFRSCLKTLGGKVRLVHGTDVWNAFFRGGSEIRVLPPNFMQDAERLRSERWHDCYADEYTTFGKFKAFNSTIVGRVTRDNHFPDCPVRQNHIHLASTPGFIHSPAYSIVKNAEKQINLGSKDYARFSCNYRHVPNNSQWRWLVSRKIIYAMQTTLPIGVVKSEVDGEWQKDSASYYTSLMLDEASFQPQIHFAAKKDWVYIAGFDVARGGGKNTKNFRGGGGDDFSLSVFGVPLGSSIPVHCLTVRKNNITAEQMSGLVHKWNTWFNFVYIVGDPLGGGLFVIDDLKKESQLIEGTKKQCTPIVEMDDFSGALGNKNLIAVRRASFWIRRMWGVMSNNSVLVNKMHEAFRGAIENRHVLFPSKWPGWPGIDEFNATEKRKFLQRNVALNQQQRAWAEMDLAVTQLMLVDIERDKDTGEPAIDTYGMFKFTSKHTKDSAYSLCYAFIGYLVYSFIQKTMRGRKGGGVTASSSAGFLPQTIIGGFDF